MYFNGAFRFKMLCLFLAILYTFTWHRRTAMSDRADDPSVEAKMAACLSLLLWISVGVGGRAIGFI